MAALTRNGRRGPASGQAEWAAAFLLFTSGERGSAKGRCLVYISKTTIG
jgi:hypothetical protein